MEKRNTKQKILEEALTLFSINGYEGVSVKQIANAVGIKDSSLYKHFKSKQDIFDTLLCELNQKFDEIVIQYSIPHGEAKEDARQYGENNLEWLKRTVKTVFLFFLKDPYASKFRHMLVIEQFNNSRASEIYRSFFIEAPLDYQKNLFQAMCDLGYFRHVDPEILAMQFYAPFFVLLTQYDTTPDQEQEALKQLEQNIDQFVLLYSMDEEDSL